MYQLRPLLLLSLGVFVSAVRGDDLAASEDTVPEVNFNLEGEHSGELPSPWEGPSHCVSGDHCLYFNPKGNNNNGQVLITTPNYAYLTATFPKITSETQIAPNSFHLAPIPGKGNGFVADRLIKKGEVIMQRQPSFLVHADAHIEMKPEVQEKIYQTALSKLSKDAQEKFLAQFGDGVRTKIDKNSFRIVVDPSGDKESGHLGVFVDVSGFNHDCRPNVHYRITNTTHTTVAVRNIHPGEELTISYIYGIARRSTRQKELQDWGFECTCSQCTLNSLEMAASDARVKEIKRLEEEIEEKMSKRGEDIKPEMGGKLVEMYLEEKLFAYLAPTYVRAALIYSMFGNEVKAKEYAEEAVGALTREYGTHAKDIQSMRELAADVKGHWSWAIKVVNDDKKKAETWKLGQGKGKKNETANAEVKKERKSEKMGKETDKRAKKGKAKKDEL
ncbi:hypothetical protein QBC40DRAFT_187244 [Triangularia verruculosa]|uniref:SET domain-containing protein n=1 Tax=Triangularia verruculosa TaxID=2587418 RepID=A0AAN6X713_9PEZI|nr:hypothetical protein QBC40DRAFT_187244 [Triangularia verruculosa]